MKGDLDAHFAGRSLTVTLITLTVEFHDMPLSLLRHVIARFAMRCRG